MSDYISREAAKTGMIRYGFTAPDMTVTEFVEDELPAADVEPVRHGRWIKDGDFLICSACEAEINIKNSLGADNHRKYCPNCGAKMDLEVENDG